MKEVGRVLLYLLLWALTPLMAAAQPARTDVHKRVGIVFLEASAENLYSKESYAQLFMAVQHQAMQAGVPFSILAEEDLTDISKLVNFDVLIFPCASHVTGGTLELIEKNLDTLVNKFGVGIITSGDFLTSNQLNEDFPGDSYSRMKKLLGVTYTRTVNGAMFSRENRTRAS